MKNKETLTSYSILGGFILFLIVYHVFGYIGHYGVDDLLYARLANDWINGTVDNESHFAFRIPVVVFTGLMYKMFGVNDFASSLPSLLFSAGVLFMVFKVLEKKGNLVLAAGLGLSLLSDWFIFYTDKLMADVYVTFAVFGALFVIQHYRYQYTKQEKPIIHGIGLALFLLLGFTAKGTIVLFLPVLFFLFFYDLNKEIYSTFWKYTVIAIISVFVLYFGITYLATGSVLSRFEAIAKNGYLNLCSYDQQSIIFLIDRITYQFFDLIVSKGMAVGFIILTAFMMQKDSIKIFKMEDQFSFFAVMGIVLLLSCNFMSISIEHYIPMCLDPRHFLFLVPVVAIPGAIIIQQFLQDRKLRIQLVIVSLIAAIYVFEIDELMYWKLYMPLFVFLAIISLIPPRIKVSLIATLLFLIVLAIAPFKMFSYAQEVAYDKQKEISIKFLNEHQKEESYVITSDVQRSLFEYYNGFKKDSKLKVLVYDEFKEDTLTYNDKFLFKNWYTMYLSGLEERQLPFYARSLDGMQELFKDSVLNISIYKLNGIDNPDETIDYTLNDYESVSLKNWRTQKKDITDRFVFRGNSSHVAPKYSSTYELPMDGLEIENAKTILITANLKAHFNKATNAKMIVEIVNEEGSYFWESMSVDHFVKAYNNWWPIHYETFIAKEEIKPNSILKVYMYNEDEETIYVDDFEIILQKSIK